MSTCGYTCPQCEGKGFMEDGTPCDWCSVEVKSEKEKVESDDDEKNKIYFLLSNFCFNSYSYSLKLFSSKNYDC